MCCTQNSLKPELSPLHLWFQLHGLWCATTMTNCNGHQDAFKHPSINQPMTCDCSCYNKCCHMASWNDYRKQSNNNRTREYVSVRRLRLKLSLLDLKLGINALCTQLKLNTGTQNHFADLTSTFLKCVCVLCALQRAFSQLPKAQTHIPN